MNIFKYRNLALGCGVFLVSLFVSYFLSTITKSIIIALSVIILAVLTVLLFAKGMRFIRDMLFKAALSLCFVCFAMIISINTFDRDLESLSFCNDELYSVEGVVSEVESENAFSGKYIFEIDKINGEKASLWVILDTSDDKLDCGHRIEAIGVFTQTQGSLLGFNEKEAYISRSILLRLECTEYTFIEEQGLGIRGILMDINSFLDAQLFKLNDEGAYSLTSALFLGNRDKLSPTLARNYSRLGLSHILALSGMHLSVVITIFSFIFDALLIRKFPKFILLLLFSTLFIGITGFSESAIRAGLMVFIVLLLSLLGEFLDNISALFLSVTIICSVSPYSIFSLSLILSFLSMLGCLCSYRFMRKTKVLKKIKGGFARFFALCAISSGFATVFTLPVICLSFGSVALLAPVSNFALSPAFTLLIYLCPAYICLADVPFLNWALTKIIVFISDFLGYAGQTFGTLPGITLPLVSVLQRIFIFALFTAFVYLICSSPKMLKPSLVASLVCAALLSVSSLYIVIDRSQNLYVSAYNSKDNDIVLIENGCSLSVVDMTKTFKSSYTLALNSATYLGYDIIDSYVLTELSEYSSIFFENLTGSVIIKRLIVPEPTSKEEREALEKIQAICKQEQIVIEKFKPRITLSGIELEFAQTSGYNRSDVNSTVFSVRGNSSVFTYVGSGAYELCDEFVDSAVYDSDFVVFGSRGPVNHIPYKYDAPYLDACVFLGKSNLLIYSDFLFEISDKIIKFEGIPVRFLLE